MLAVDDRILQAAAITNVGVVGLGGLCAVGFVLWLVRSGQWRNPLARVAAGDGGPTAVQALIGLLAYFGLGILFVRVALARVGATEEPEVGSHAWHVAAVAAALASLCVAMLIVWLLRRAPAVSPAEKPTGRSARVFVIGLLAALIITAICTVQLNMATVVWQWFHPDETPPVHPVLLATRSSAWGPWGIAQLFAVAVTVAPAVEELLFRGLLLQMLWRYTRHAWVSILVCGAFFGLIHGQPQDILPLGTMGVMLGYVRLRTGSLLACIVAHALFNARTMVVAVFFPELMGGG